MGPAGQIVVAVGGRAAEVRRADAEGVATAAADDAVRRGAAGGVDRARVDQPGVDRPGVGDRAVGRGGVDLVTASDVAGGP